LSYTIDPTDKACAYKLASLLSPNAATSRVYPHCTYTAVITPTAHDSRISVGGEGNRIALVWKNSHGTSSDKFISLLNPYAATSRVHPRCARKIVIPMPTDDGGIPIRGDGGRDALVCIAYGASADQFISLLGPLRLQNIVHHNCDENEQDQCAFHTSSLM
jgi:hypothetical protein